ncbi:hydroxypyruvate isomerase family protein [Burkholderia glumae]
MLKFSANIGLLFNELPFEERIAAAAQSGFDAVEFPFQNTLASDELSGLLRNCGMTQSLANMRYELNDLGLGAAPGRESEFHARLAEAIDYANGTRCKVLHVLAGKVPTGVTAKHAEETLRENLRTAAAFAAQSEITVVVEAINRRDVPDFVFKDVHHAASVVESVNASNLRLLLDIYHAGTMHEDIPAVIRRYAGLAGYVQIAGFAGRNEPSDGAANYVKLLQDLSHAGYDGYVGCEYRPLGETLSRLAWLGEVKQALI